MSSRTKVAREEALMKFDGEIMEILAAYDLIGSLRAAAELTGWRGRGFRDMARACPFLLEPVVR